MTTKRKPYKEQMFNTDPGNPPNAFSVVKGLQLSAAQVQRIYQITQANISSTLPQLNLDYETEKEILNAVNVGKEVVTHTDLVTVPGFTGAGYIILDPVTGDGAFKISGGGNGGFLYLIAGIIFGLLAIVILVSVGIYGVLGWGWMLALMAKSIDTHLDLNQSIELDWNIFVSVRLIGFLVAIGMFGLASFGALTILALISTMIMGIMSAIKLWSYTPSINGRSKIIRFV